MTQATSRSHQPPAPLRPGADYRELKRQVDARNLARRQHGYYLLQAAIALGFIGISIALIMVTGVFAIELLAAVSLAVAFTHIGFLIHDAGHRQILASPRQNDVYMLVMGAVIGVGRSWWFDNHNKHHAEPNDLDADPHLAIPILAFDRATVEAAGPVKRRILRLQAWYFFPLLSLEAGNARVASLRHVLAGRAKYPLAEAAGLFAHIAVYVAVALVLFPWWQALIFVVVHQLLTGLYLGSVFAPNHKGMPLNQGRRLSFLRTQVLSSRNMRPGRVVDFWCGGLNYQIEHHLFPRVPRNRLGELRAIVRDYCHEHGIEYTETGFLAAYRDVVGHLAEVVRTPTVPAGEVVKA